MNNLLIDYQNDILMLFKNHYRRMITKSTDITFEEILLTTMKDLNIVKTSKEETVFLESWFHCVHHQDFFKNYTDGYFTEIIFHSHKVVQVIGLHEKKSIHDDVISCEDFQLSLEVLALKNQATWNFKDPFASFNIRIKDLNLRATLIHFSTSANSKSKVFLRSIPTDTPSIELFNLDYVPLEIIKSIIVEKKNVLVSGGTGSGKTTLLRSLMAMIPHDEHIIVLEDTYEILNHHPGQTSFLANKEQQNKSLKDYCAYSLRMSPDRLIVGEMRSTEVVPFLLAMNTGHKGLMSTIHASSGVDALSRISLLFSLFSEGSDISYSLVTRLVCKNVDYVIHMEHKKVKEICRVIGSEGETPFYERVNEA
ncbi:MAG: Flp pilus assembly complex ATPase component TadA [Bacteriovorax sp.]|nr:Flp pilus assembly complex ATPase component TadA [Bacteriovorax sp.]